MRWHPQDALQSRPTVAAACLPLGLSGFPAAFRVDHTTHSNPRSGATETASVSVRTPHPNRHTPPPPQTHAPKVRTSANPGHEPQTTHRPPLFLLLPYIPHPRHTLFAPKGRRNAATGEAMPLWASRNPSNQAQSPLCPSGAKEPPHIRARHETRPPRRPRDFQSRLHSTPAATTPRPIQTAPTPPPYGLRPMPYGLLPRASHRKAP